MIKINNSEKKQQKQNILKGWDYNVVIVLIVITVLASLIVLEVSILEIINLIR